MKKLAIVTTHPIQYNAPWFKLLAERKKVELMVFYTWGQLKDGDKYDPGFGKKVEWDIPLLEGYNYTFVKNTSGKPGSEHFNGIVNPTLVKEIEQWGADAVLVFGWKFKSHLKVLRHFKNKIKILFRGDSNLLDEPKGFAIKKLARKILLTWIYSHVDTALYVGKANKEYYLKYGLQNEQLVFAPHAVDNERFTKPQPGNPIREAYGIKGNEVVFLFAGKLEGKKDPALLINAFLDCRMSNARLLIIGNGLLETSLKESVEQQDHEFKQNIRFIDFQNQSKMPEIYQAADVFVLPSQGPGETWGLAVNEAMAAGKAVLVSDKCGCAIDLVEEGNNGFTFESNNAADLAAKMKKLYAEKNILSKMGSSSLDIIKNWNFEKICEAIEQTI